MPFQDRLRANANVVACRLKTHVAALNAEDRMRRDHARVAQHNVGFGRGTNSIDSALEHDAHAVMQAPNDLEHNTLKVRRARMPSSSNARARTPRPAAQCRDHPSDG